MKTISFPSSVRPFLDLFWPVSKSATTPKDVELYPGMEIHVSWLHPWLQLQQKQAGNAIQMLKVNDFHDMSWVEVSFEFVGIKLF